MNIKCCAGVVPLLSGAMWIGVLAGGASLSLSAPVLAQDVVVQPAEDLLNADGRRVMPEGWQGLSAEVLATELERYYSPPWGTPEESQQVITHVWENYLSDAAFITSADWEVLSVMTRQIGSRLGEPEGLMTDELRAQYRDRLTARVQADVASDRTGFETMRVAMDELRRACVGQSKRAGLTATWCTGHDTAGLTLRQQTILCAFLKDRVVAPGNMSAVYDGFITVPRGGAYSFSRYLCDQAFAGDYVVVQIGGQVVLDTRPNPRNNDGEATFQGPVDLPAGRQAFTATFVRIDDPDTPDDVGPVEHVLRWAQGDEDLQLITPGSYVQPDGRSAGLRARYYTGAVAGNPVIEQTVPAVDQVGDSYAQRHQDLIERVKVLMDSNLRIAGWPAELEQDELSSPTSMDWVARTLLSVKSCSERSMLIDNLCVVHAGWVGGLHPGGALYGLLQQTVPVPGDATVTLMATWSASRPQFRTQVGYYPGWGEYMKVNYGPYAGVGRLLASHEPMWEQVLEIRDECLTEPNGACDLELLQVYLEGCKVAGKQGWHSGRVQAIAYIDDVLQDETLSGDVRATWLIAHAMCAESTQFDERPRPMLAWRHLERALLEAESVETRFLVLNEMMARAISVGRAELATSMLDSLAHQFSPPPEVIPGVTDAEGNPMTYTAQIQRWREQAVEHAGHMAAWEAREVRNEALARERSEIAHLEGLVAEIEEDEAAGTLADVQRDLDQAKARLEALETSYAEEDAAAQDAP